jgi:hypothetical protein
MTARIVALMQSAQSDLELAASELNEAAFKLQDLRAKIDPDAAALRQTAEATKVQLSFIAALTLAAACAAERLDVAADLVEDLAKP